MLGSPAEPSFLELAREREEGWQQLHSQAPRKAVVRLQRGSQHSLPGSGAEVDEHPALRHTWPRTRDCGPPGTLLHAERAATELLGQREDLCVERQRMERQRVERRRRSNISLSTES